MRSPPAITGEPHALDGPADPLDQQAITWCAALEWRQGEDHTIDRPEREFWRGYRADFWPGPQLGWATPEPETGRPLTARCSQNPESRTWTFRRIRYGGHYVDEVSDVTLINWPQVDYWLTPLVGVTDADRRVSVTKARELALCFVHWLQTDAVRPDGGAGYPGMRLCPDVLGTQDGLAAAACGKAAGIARLSSPSWKLMSGWRPGRAPIALRLFPTPSASAVTGSIYIPAQHDADTLTSRPIRFRSHWAHCSRCDWATC